LKTKHKAGFILYSKDIIFVIKKEKEKKRERRNIDGFQVILEANSTSNEI